MLLEAVARSSSGSIAVSYVLLVLWMTIMFVYNGQEQATT